MSGPNYARLKGFGDLAGDSSNPNSPDYVEPSYGLDDAQGDVANQLIESGDVGELVTDVHEALPGIQWAYEHEDLPRHLRDSLRCLLRKAELLDRMVDAQVEVMS